MASCWSCDIVLVVREICPWWLCQTWCSRRRLEVSCTGGTRILTWLYTGIIDSCQPFSLLYSTLDFKSSCQDIGRVHVAANERQRGTMENIPHAKKVLKVRTCLPVEFRTRTRWLLLGGCSGWAPGTKKKLASSPTGRSAVVRLTCGQMAMSETRSTGPTQRPWTDAVYQQSGGQ